MEKVIVEPLLFGIMLDADFIRSIAGLWLPTG